MNDEELKTEKKCEKCGAPMFKSRFGYADYCRETKCFFGTEDESEIMGMVCPGM